MNKPRYTLSNAISSVWCFTFILRPISAYYMLYNRVQADVFMFTFHFVSSSCTILKQMYSYIHIRILNHLSFVRIFCISLLRLLLLLLLSVMYCLICGYRARCSIFAMFCTLIYILKSLMWKFVIYNVCSTCSYCSYMCLSILRGVI